MKLDQFVDRDYESLNSGVDTTPTRSFVGNWMGYPINMSTNVDGTNAAGHTNVIHQRECMALAVQMEPVTHNWFDVNFLADKFIVEEIFGSAIMRNDHGVMLLGS